MNNRSAWLVQLATWERARVNAQSQMLHAQAETELWLKKLLEDGMEMGDILEYLHEEEDDGEQ